VCDVEDFEHAKHQRQTQGNDEQPRGVADRVYQNRQRQLHGLITVDTGWQGHAERFVMSCAPSNRYFLGFLSLPAALSHLAPAKPDFNQSSDLMLSGGLTQVALKRCMSSSITIFFASFHLVRPIAVS